MQNLKKKISKRKSFSKSIFENDFKSSSLHFLCKKLESDNFEEAKILEKDSIVTQNLSLYLKELDFSKADLNFTLPKSLQISFASHFISKDFINSLFELIQNNSNLSQLTEILIFFRKLINIDEELEKNEISKGLMNMGLLLVFNSFFNQNLIYFSHNSSSQIKNQAKHTVFKLMELSIEILIVMFEIIDVKFMMESPLNDTLMMYLENCNEFEMQMLALNYFDAMTKKINPKAKFFEEKNLQRFLTLIFCKMTKNNLKSMEINILYIKIIYNLALKSHEIPMLCNEMREFFFKQNETLLENIFSIVGVKIFEEFNILMNSFDERSFHPPKKNKQKFIKDFVLNHHFKEGLNIWISSENSLEKALDLLIDIYKDEKESSERTDSVSSFDENDQMELESEGEVKIEGDNENKHKNDYENQNKHKHKNEGEWENIKIEEEMKMESEKELNLKKNFEFVDKQSLLDYGLERMLFDKLRFPVRNQIEFVILYESKIGYLFKKIKKIVFLTVSCFISIYSSNDKKFSEDPGNLCEILLVCINETLTLEKELIKNQDNFEEVDLKDILVCYLKLLCLLIDKNQHICEKIPYLEVISLNEKIKNCDEEAFLIFIDIVALRFGPKFSIIKENEEVCKMLGELLEHKGNVLVKGQLFNCIFDIFQDEKFDENFWKLRILEKMQKENFNVKKLKKKEGRLKKADKAFLMEVSINLRNFITYKEKMMGY